jgi:rubrerythrin
MAEIGEFASVNDILEFAIAREEESHQFYASLSTRMERPWMQDVFEQFAQEELGHKAKLQRVREGKRLLSVEAKVLDLKIADYLVTGEVSEDMDYQQALIVAMKKEKAAFKLYTDLAGRVDDAVLKSMFLGLAQEEARHKLCFEVEYDDVILTDN